MSRQAAIVKREKSLAEQLIVITLFAVLMSVFIYYYFESEQNITSTGFVNISGMFATQLSVIRSQWYMESKPDVVWLEESHAPNQKGNKRRVSVNKYGWVISSKKSLQCEDIWQMVMTTPRLYMKQPISAIFMQLNDNKSKNADVDQQLKQSCRYSILNGQYFEYYPLTGKIINSQ